MFVSTAVIVRKQFVILYNKNLYNKNIHKEQAKNKKKLIILKLYQKFTVFVRLDNKLHDTHNFDISARREKKNIGELEQYALWLEKCFKLFLFLCRNINT